MPDTEILRAYLGAPSEVNSHGVISEIQREWQVDFDGEYIAMCNDYGDLVVEDYMRIYGPRSLRERASALGPTQEKIRSRIGCSQTAVLPSPGGALIWGSTVEGDVLYLMPKQDRWTVSAFRRNWADWYDSDLSVIEWLVRVFDQDICTDWMPEWPKLPLATLPMRFIEG